MNSQEIVDYVMNTPHNTNPSILKQMIDSSKGGVTSWNDLEDKPFGEKDGELFYEYGPYYFWWQFNENYYGIYIDVEQHTFESLANREELTVIFDGKRYNVPVEVIEGADSTRICFGNRYLNRNPGENTGEPFLIDISNIYDSYIVVEEMGEHSFKIGTGGCGEISTIDPIYLPEHEHEYEHSWNNLTDKPFGEIENRVLMLSNSTISGGPFLGALDGYGDRYGILKASALIPGDTYVAVVNGEEYVGVAERTEDTSSDNNEGIRLFSHGEYPEDFSDAPISLGSYSNQMYISFENEESSYNIELYHVESDVKLIDKKYIPDTISRTNHTHIWKDLEDKPFIEESVTGILVPEQAISIGGCDTRYVDFDKILVLGEMYTVVIDGVNYEIECVYNDEYGAQHQLIINDNLEIYQDVGSSGLIFLNRLENTVSHTISIAGPTISETLEPKYLPKASAVADVTEAPTAEDFNALLAALREAGYLAT